MKWDKWGGFNFSGQDWQPATQPVQFTYDRLGQHTVDLIVMDTGYLMDDTECVLEVVPPGGNNPPTAQLVITPTTGTITTTFTLDVSGSTDDHDAIYDLSVRFDWTDDGVFDTSWLNASQTYTVTFHDMWGQFTVRARVMDSGGLTDDATQTITVTTPYRIFLPLATKSQ
ncbi:MAG: hypothetical protein D6775_12795 [Caldilineae bacterium]|nr:MAG: hypothetical protein D6775_12795 [Caldilineae bacterium]